MCSSEFNLQGTIMNYLPSKELLSKVLETKAWNIKTINNTVIFLIGNGSEYRLNIHELAHMCKEWAFVNGFIINSGRTTSNDWCTTIYKVLKLHPYIEEISHTWEDTEPEAIFRACQWILDNRN